MSSRSSIPSSPPRTRAAGSASSSPARSSPSTAATSRRRRAPGAGRRSPSISRCAPAWLISMRSDARRPTGLPPLAAEAASAVLAPPRLPAEAAASVPLARRAARAAELPALAAALVEGLANRLGIAPPRLAADALARLAAHAWPGDVAELEAVLARALLVADGDVIEAAHLVLATESPAAGSAAPEAPRGAELEYLLAELAHELRNPLVTIKTFASHLPALLEDAELRGRFAALTTEAIERMDGLLENVLAFARLGAPHREAVEVGPIMERVLAELEPELAGRALRVRRAVAPTGRCAADPEHR